MDLNVISAIAFYVLIILFIYFNRKKFIIQHKIVALYRTKFGLRLMDKIANSFPRFLAFLGYSGIFVGFLGMAVIIFFLFQGAWSLLTNPAALPAFTPIIPGVKIPGSPIYVPFWYGIISLFIIILIHEFSHGVLSRVHKIPVDSSGFGMMAIFPIAFVEPNEAHLKKAAKKKQLSIFAAGPFSNIVTAVLVAIIALSITIPFQESLVSYHGVYFSEIVENEPASIAGVESNVVFTHINNQSINHTLDFMDALSDFSPGDTLILSNENVSYSVIAGKNPQNESVGYLGVKGILSEYQIKSTTSKLLFYIIDILNNLFNWLFILSIGIGLANLLPLGPVDGGRMLFLALDHKKHSKVILKYVTLITLFLLLFNLAFPYLRNLVNFFI